MTISKKMIVLLLSVMLIIGCVAGTSIAWLVTQTEPIINTFTVGDITIKLEETATDFKLLPGTDIAKDPKVTVLAGSEECWLFVKIEESNRVVAGSNPEKHYFEYAIASGWHVLDGVSGVYWQEVDNALNANVTLDILAGNKVTVPSAVTKTDLEAAKTKVNSHSFSLVLSQLLKRSAVTGSKLPKVVS